MANQKLNDKQKKKIIADYIETQNYLQTSKMNDVSVDTVRRLVMDNEEVKNILQRKKEENTLTTLEYMDSQHETKKRILSKLLHGIEVKAEDIDMLTNVKDLATAYGIIVDKELKWLEMRRGTGNRNDLQKVEELLGKLEQQAGVDIHGTDTQ